VLEILKKQFPGKRLVFIFDNSPIHRKKADDALNAQRMNVWPEGVQPCMRYTQWTDSRGRVHKQKMVDKKGAPRGLRAVLTERGLFREGMVKEDMVEVLSAQPDFANQPTLIEEFLSSRGHVAIFLPKFHAELNPVELIWAKAKRFARDHNKLKMKHLRKMLPTALTVSLPELQSYFDHCSAWLSAYAKGLKYVAAKAFVLAGRKQRQADRAKGADVGDSEMADVSESESQSESENENENESANESENEHASENESENEQESDQDVTDSEEDENNSSNDKMAVDDDAQERPAKPTTHKRTKSQKSDQQHHGPSSRAKRQRFRQHADGSRPAEANNVSIALFCVGQLISFVVCGLLTGCSIRLTQKAV